MEQAVEFEPTDSVVFMLNTIANNIAQRNANYLTTLQNVSIGISGFTNRLVNPFSQACLIILCSLKPSHSTPSFFLFGIFGDKSTSPEAKQNRRNNGASLRHVFSHSGSLVTMSWRSPRNNRKYQLFARFYNKKTLTVPLRNVSKLVRSKDRLLNKPPNSMCSESRFQ